MSKKRGWEVGTVYRLSNQYFLLLENEVDVPYLVTYQTPVPNQISSSVGDTCNVPVCTDPKLISSGWSAVLAEKLNVERFSRVRGFNVQALLETWGCPKREFEAVIVEFLNPYRFKSEAIRRHGSARSPNGRYANLNELYQRYLVLQRRFS